MAVVPKQTDSQNRYDPHQDLTADQLHRFGQVAQQAHERRMEQLKNGTVSAVARAAKKAALKPVVKPKREKPNTIRYAAWLIVVMALSLWVMYMNG